MENQNVCKDCGEVKTNPAGTKPSTKNVCEGCGQGVQPKTENEDKKEGQE